MSGWVGLPKFLTAKVVCYMVYPCAVLDCLGEVRALRVETLSEWRHTQLVPVPKKGDLSYYDNWRGVISLLDVMGKLFPRVLNDKLQLVVEETVSDPRCGFWTDRGCVDINVVLVHIEFMLCFSFGYDYISLTTLTFS